MSAAVLTKEDVLAALHSAAVEVATRFLASSDAEAIRARLVEEASCASLDQVAAMWGVSAKVARKRLADSKVKALDFGHRSPRYSLEAVRAVVKPGSAAEGRKPRVTVIEFPSRAEGAA